MKKNDGYVIIYVVFVILFLCIIAVGTCTSALNNLKVQNAAVAQLQDRYTAEGNLEQFMAEACVLEPALTNNGYETPEAAAASAKAAFAATITSNDDVTCVGSGVWVENSNEYKVTLESSCGSTKVSAEVSFTVKITIAPYEHDTGTYDSNNQKITVQRFAYSISGATSKYLTYSLGTDGGEAE